MNWEAIGAVGEALGAVGVIVSLVYLAVQIRQNTRSVRMASHHGVADQFTQTTLATLQDPDLALVVMRGVADLESLSESERARFAIFLMAIFRGYEEVHQLHRSGLVDPEFWAARNRSLRNWLANRGVRSWWTSRTWSDMFVDSFRDLVDEVVDGIESTARPR